MTNNSSTGLSLKVTKMSGESMTVPVVPEWSQVFRYGSWHACHTINISYEDADVLSTFVGEAYGIEFLRESFSSIYIELHDVDGDIENGETGAVDWKWEVLQHGEPASYAAVSQAVDAYLDHQMREIIEG
jgi:hypothetical protein